MVNDIFLIIMLGILCFFDCKERRIPNILLLLTLLWAISYHAYAGGVSGVFFSLKGFTAGIFLLILPFIMNGMGAGDVKLLGVIGAAKGTTFVLHTFLWMAIWGGVIAILYLLINGNFKETVSRLWTGLILAGMGSIHLSESLNKEAFSVYYPYGVAIAMGVLSTYCISWCFQ